MSFKKICICVIVLVVSASGAFAQIKKEETDPLGYGIKLGLNYTTNGMQYSQYSGLAGVSMGIFFSKPVSPKFTLFFEPAFTSVKFRDNQNDNRYNAYYIDGTTFTYFYPSNHNTDFAFIGGLRLSYLLAHNSEVFDDGNYTTKTLSYNQNQDGKIEAGLMGGVSVALSPVLNFEFLYNHSLSNNNTPTTVLGRSSTFEVNLRLNAVALRKSLDNKSQSIEEQVQQYHKGVLLVMLITPNEKEIARLASEHKNKDIELIETEIRIRNSKVIKEFNKNFAFCPVYYFMDTSIYKLLSGNISNIFVNYNMQPDSTIQVNTDNFFIASFCEDISDYTKRKHFGLFVYDKQMNQLGKPFNHPNQLASPVFDYFVVKNTENTTRRPSYITVPFDRLIDKFNGRLFRYIN